MPLIIPSNSQSATGYTIDQSIRFNDDDSASLNRTPSSAGNRKTFTFSFWVKRGNLGVSNKHIFAIQIDSSNQFVIRFTNSDKLQIYDYQSASMQLIFDTDAVFRDVSAWYHLFFVFSCRYDFLEILWQHFFFHSLANIIFSLL